LINHGGHFRELVSRVCRFEKPICNRSSTVIEVDDHQIRNKSSKDVLERAVIAAQSDWARSQMSTEWRARQDSNL
jgi:hypothetical protein